MDHFSTGRLSLTLFLQMSNTLAPKKPKEAIIYLAGSNNYVISWVLWCAENFLLIITQWKHNEFCGQPGRNVILKAANGYGSWLGLRESNCNLQCMWDNHLKNPTTQSRSLRGIVIFRTIVDQLLKKKKKIVLFYSVFCVRRKTHLGAGKEEAGCRLC